MGDHLNCGAQFIFKLVHQIQYLGLNGNIKGRCRFIGNKQLRIAGQGHGNHSPLPHTAGQLMRIVVYPFMRCGNLNPFKHLNGCRQTIFFVHPFMKGKHFRNLISDAEYGVKGGHRFLKNHGNTTAPDTTHCFLAQLGEIFTMKFNMTANYFTWRVGNNAHNGGGCNRLTAPRFPNDTKRLSPVKMI